MTVYIEKYKYSTIHFFLLWYCSMFVACSKFDAFTECYPETFRFECCPRAPRARTKQVSPPHVLKYKKQLGSCLSTLYKAVRRRNLCRALDFHVMFARHEDFYSSSVAI